MEKSKRDAILDELTAENSRLTKKVALNQALIDQLQEEARLESQDPLPFPNEAIA